MCEVDNYATFSSLMRLFDRWCVSQNIDKDFVNLWQLLLEEEFKNCLSNEDEHKAKTLQQAAVLADEYTLMHQRVFPQKIEAASIKNCPP